MTKPVKNVETAALPVAETAEAAVAAPPQFADDAKVHVVYSGPYQNVETADLSLGTVKKGTPVLVTGAFANQLLHNSDWSAQAVNTTPEENPQ